MDNDEEPDISRILDNAADSQINILQDAIWAAKEVLRQLIRNGAKPDALELKEKE